MDFDNLFVCTTVFLTVGPKCTLAASHGEHANGTNRRMNTRLLYYLFHQMRPVK